MTLEAKLSTVKDTLTEENGYTPHQLLELTIAAAESVIALEDQITDLKLRLQHVETYLEHPDGPPQGGAQLSGEGVERVDVTDGG